MKTTNSIFYNFYKSNTILFLNGGPEGNSALFYGFFLNNFLFEKFNLLLVDLPGSGFSTDNSRPVSFDEIASIYENEIKKQKVKNVILVAESIGAVAACLLSSKITEKFIKLILIAPFLDVETTKISSLNKIQGINCELRNFLKNLEKSPNLIKTCILSKEVEKFIQVPIEMRRVRMLRKRKFNVSSKVLPDLVDKGLHDSFSRFYIEYFFHKKIDISLKVITHIGEKLELDNLRIEKFLKFPEKLEFKEFRNFLDYYNLFFENMNVISYRQICREQCLEGDESVYNDDLIRRFDASLVAGLELNDNLSSFSIESFLRKLMTLNCPVDKVVIICGDQDVLATAHVMTEMKEFFKNSKFVFIENGGHSILFESPSEVCKVFNEYC